MKHFLHVPILKTLQAAFYFALISQKSIEKKLLEHGIIGFEFYFIRDLHLRLRCYRSYRKERKSRMYEKKLLCLYYLIALKKNNLNFAISPCCILDLLTMMIQKEFLSQTLYVK